MAEKNLLDSLPGILFADDQANKLNEYVKENIDGSLFLFLHYTPDTIKPYSYDGKYIMGVSNLYKLIKDSGWVLEKNDKILKDGSVKALKNYINTIHLLREVQNHNVRADNAIRLQAAEKWWSDAGVESQRPESEEDYQKALSELEKLGKSLIKESEYFVKNVSKLDEAKRKVAITTWTEEIISRYVKERNLFQYSINIYQKYSAKHERKKWNNVIVSYFINDYYCLRNAEKNGILLYSLPKYKKMVDGYTGSKLNLFKVKYGLNLKNIDDLIDDIECDQEKYINLFFEKVLSELIKEAVKETGTLEIDTVCEYILDKTITVELKNDDAAPFKIENVKCFDLDG